MSADLARESRQKAKDKARRLAHGDPHERVDGSSWTEAEPMNAEAKTGLRPISRRQYKRGGKVEGAEAKHHAGRKPRKAGGRLADELVNRNVREANESRSGVKHVGGFKRGGRAHRDMGGPLAPAISGQGRLGGFSYPTAHSPAQSLGLKTGGRAKHSDEAEDRRLVKQMVRKRALIGKHYGGEVHHRDCECERCMGGEARPHGGHVPEPRHGAMHEEGGREPRKHGGHLSAEQRRHIPKSEFGLPGERKYPMPDKSHAANAKARASQAEHAGRLSKGAERKIDEKADRVLARASGGRTKGKTNINIVIAPGHQGQAPMPAPQSAAPRPAAPMPMTAPNAASPTPMPMPYPMPLPQQPQTPRKHGGRLPAMEAGAGGGLGRLEKLRKYGHEARDHDGHY